MRTRFILFCFPVAHEKQRESVALIEKRFSERWFTACFCSYSLSLEVKLRHTNELYMLFSVSCNRSLS